MAEQLPYVALPLNLKKLARRCQSNVEFKFLWQQLLFKLFVKNFITTGTTWQRRMQFRRTPTSRSINNRPHQHPRNNILMNQSSLLNRCCWRRTMLHTKTFRHLQELSTITSSWWQCKLRLMLPMLFLQCPAVYDVPCLRHDFSL